MWFCKPAAPYPVSHCWGAKSREFCSGLSRNGAFPEQILMALYWCRTRALPGPQFSCRHQAQDLGSVEGKVIACGPGKATFVSLLVKKNPGKRWNTTSSLFLPSPACWFLLGFVSFFLLQCTAFVSQLLNSKVNTQNFRFPWATP